MDIEQSDLDNAVNEMQRYLEGMEFRQAAAVYQLSEAVSDVGTTATTVVLVLFLVWAGCPFHWWYVLLWLVFLIAKEVRRRTR